MNRAVKILVALIVVVAIGLALYLLFKNASKDEVQEDTPNQGDPSTEPTTPPPGNGITIIDTPPQGEDIPIEKISSGEVLRQVTDFPVSGYVALVRNERVSDSIFNSETGTTDVIERSIPVEVLRYVKKETGEIYEATVGESIIEQRQKTTNKVPKTEDALFFNNGNSVLFRFIGRDGRTIESVFGEFPPEFQSFASCGALDTTEPLSRGDNGPGVRALQQFLANELSLSGKGSDFSIDGVFGGGTENYLKEFQEKVGITQSGAFDPETLAYIQTSCGESTRLSLEESRKPVFMETTFGPSGIENVTSSPDTSRIFYTKKDSGELKGFTTTGGSAIPRQVFSSPYTEWLPGWANSSLITLTTFASREYPGYVYGLNPGFGGVVKLFGPVTGITANVSPNGKWLLFNESTRNGFQTAITSLSKQMIHRLDTPTLPEKCVWSHDGIGVICAVPKQIPSGAYPDDWYKGTRSFSDEFWRIDVEPFLMTHLFTPDDSYDFIKPIMSPRGDFLYITDKRTGFLWVLSL